jgi:hypothetical protein
MNKTDQTTPFKLIVDDVEVSLEIAAHAMHTILY